MSTGGPPTPPQRDDSQLLHKKLHEVQEKLVDAVQREKDAVQREKEAIAKLGAEKTAMLERLLAMKDELNIKNIECLRLSDLNSIYYAELNRGVAMTNSSSLALASVAQRTERISTTGRVEVENILNQVPVGEIRELNLDPTGQLAGRKESYLQSFYTGKLCGKNIGGFEVFDTHAARLLPDDHHASSLSPDFVAFVYDQNKRSERLHDLARAAFVIELKALDYAIPTEADLSKNADFTQFLNYLELLLDRAAARNHIYGLFTNSVWSVLVKVHWNAQMTGTTTIAEVKCLGNDPPAGQNAPTAHGACLKWLLSRNQQELGIPPTMLQLPLDDNGEQKTIVPGKFLGHGRTCSAFEVSAPRGDGGDDAHQLIPRTMVLKYYHTDQQAETERNWFRRLADAKVPHVTTLADVQPIDPRAVLVVQRGFGFDMAGRWREPGVLRRISNDHFNQLRRALRCMHDNGFIHGDIWTGNIFWLAHNEAMFNDWSCMRWFAPEERRTTAFELAKHNDALRFYQAIGRLDGEVAQKVREAVAVKCSELLQE